MYSQRRLLDGAAVPFERETEPPLSVLDTVPSGSIELIRRGFGMSFGTSCIKPVEASDGPCPPKEGDSRGFMAGLSLPPPSDKLLARDTSPPRLDSGISGCDHAFRRDGPRAKLAAAVRRHDRATFPSPRV